MSSVDNPPHEETTHVLLDRLLQNLGYAADLNDYDPWGVGFKISSVNEVFAIEKTPYSAGDSYSAANWDGMKHARRIRYLMQSPRDMRKPLVVYSVCSDSRSYVEADLLDGHHRLAAHVLLGNKAVPVNYSGRVDLLEWLMGNTDEAP